MQDSVRLLMLISAAARPLDEPVPSETPEGAVAVLRGQMLLQALDFWLRNPDYLADELLNRYEVARDPDDLSRAGSILDSDEPEVRSYPMLRYLFGAYEPLDEALSVLRSPGLIIIRRLPGAPGKVWRHDYYLTEKGQQVASDVLAAAPDFEYYVHRTALVVKLAAGRSGSELKNVQYGQQEYGATKYLDHIGGITDRVRARLTDLRNEAGGAA